MGHKAKGLINRLIEETLTNGPLHFITYADMFQ